MSGGETDAAVEPRLIGAYEGGDGLAAQMAQLGAKIDGLEALLRYKLVVGRTFAAVMMNGGGVGLETEPAAARADGAKAGEAGGGDAKAAGWVVPRAEWTAPDAEWAESPVSLVSPVPLVSLVSPVPPLRKRTRQ